jgi:general secretion pathway protein K
VANRPKARTNRLPASDRPERPSLPRAGASQSGFALVAVIWTLGLITLLGMAVIVGARYRTKTSSNYASVAAAEMAAESAVNLAIATALAATPDQAVNFPLRCRLPGGERATIMVEEETGKIDLNTASPTAWTRFFTALTGGPRLADAGFGSTLSNLSMAGEAASISGSGRPERTVTWRSAARNNRGDTPSI